MPLRFHLLGPFEAWRDEQPIPVSAWRTRQTLAVLKLLLDQRERDVPFERLADAIWPESDADAARTSLRGSVRTIRRVLEPELAAGAASRHLRTTPLGYRFVAAGCSFDVDAFAAASQAGLAAERRADRDAALRAYRQAVAAYRGEYMSDDPYADWAMEGREDLRSTYLNTVERLSAQLLAAGSYTEAITDLERALRVDPLREELHGQLMRCHAEAGRRSHALAAYERCRRLLEVELGVSPSVETSRLHKEILAGKPAPAAGVVSAAAFAELDLAFVGRESELQAISAAWRRAQAETGHLVLVRGSAGVGKTELVRRFAESQGLAGQAAWLTCQEIEAELPFAPLLALLRAWLEHSATTAQVQRLGPYAPVLAHLLPQVRRLWPDCPPLAEADAPDPTQLLEALTQALLHVLTEPSALLVVDDLHWSDPSTTVWLGYALRRLPAGTLVLATARGGESLGEAHTRLRADQQRGGRLTELRLEPLSPSEVQRLVSQIQQPADKAGRLGPLLYESTQGNPLFLVEILRELRRQGQLYDAGAGGWRWRDPGPAADLPLPSSVRDAIRARVQRLQPRAQSALACFCVYGAPARASLLAAVLNEGPEAALDDLEVLLGQNLLRVTDDGLGYAIEHPLVRRVVYDDLSPGRRQEWHRRIAQVLESQLPDTAAAVQVFRHLTAGDSSDADIVRVGRLAGEQSLSQHAYLEALESFDAVRRRLRRHLPDPAAEAELAAVSERWAEALLGAGRWDDALACYQDLLGGSADPIDRSRLLRKQAQVLADVGAGGLKRALELLDQAEQDLLALDQEAPTVRAELGRVEATRSLAHYHAGDYRALLGAGDRALEIWEGLPGLERDQMEQLHRIAAAEQRLGRLRPAEARYRQLLGWARSRQDLMAEARYLDSLNIVLLHRGRLQEALDGEEEVLRVMSEFGVPKFLAITLGNRAYFLEHLGRLPAARAAYEEALRVAEVIQARYTIMHNQVGLGEVLIRLGEFEQAALTLQSAVTLAEEIGTVQRRGHAHLYLAELALEHGDLQSARRSVELGIGLGRSIADSHVERVGNPILARTLIRVGDPEGALAAVGRGLEVARAGGFVIDEGRNLVASGLALAAQSASLEAEAALARAETIFRTAGASYLLAETLYLLAATGLRPRRRAAAALDEALVLARAAGARPLLARLAEARPGPRV